MPELLMGKPSEKQKKVLLLRNKHIAFGGARGGGKSWLVRYKSKGLAVKYPGIRILIVRRSYPELINNHINILKAELKGWARYNDKDKVLRFYNGSSINFMYCDRDRDLDRLQGVEYDIIFLDEAGQLSEYQMKAISACLRGANGFPKRVYYTMNPGGQGHGYLKRIFIDRRFQDNEDASEYAFVQSLVTDNKVLMEAQPDYIKQLMALPPKLREAWLYGNWEIFEGQFFEDFRIEPDIKRCAESGLSAEEARSQHRFTHVIPAFDLNAGERRAWRIYRSYDFGYAKPFSCAWWAVDFDGVIYRIMELYGCTDEPNEGIKWTPDEQFKKIKEIESTHPWFKNRRITGVADPAIWDASRGESIADTAMRHGVHFVPGDNRRIPGWMQCHYRLQFDENGYARMYVFENCRGFIRTVPTLMYSTTHAEDLDTGMEDHIADEWRYFCMQPEMQVRALRPPERRVVLSDPLNQLS